jgi:hypothetical protein
VLASTSRVSVSSKKGDEGFARLKPNPKEKVDVTGHEPSEILERLLRETDATKEIQAFAR